MSFFDDKSLTCRDCGSQFTWTAGEQEFYASRGLTNQPSRCPTCRQARKAGGGGGGGGFERSARTLYAATCDACGRATEVPFQPTAGKPVYCQDCFRERRASTGGPGGYGRERGNRY